MTRYLQKEFQTAPVATQTEPTLESNSATNVPTIKAVNDGIEDVRSNTELKVNDIIELFEAMISLTDEIAFVTSPNYQTLKENIHTKLDELKGVVSNGQ